VSNVVSFVSGEPFSVGSAGSALNAPGNAQRADQVKPSAAILGGIGRSSPWFDPAAFAQINEGRFGTAGFNSMRGPGLGNWDIGIYRRLRLSERHDLRFRLESFNFTNTPKFDNPRATAGSSGFGEIQSSYGEREFRIGLRRGLRRGAQQPPCFPSGVR